MSVVNESAMSYTEETGQDDQDDDGALTLDDLKSDNTASSPYVTQHAGSTPKVYACCRHLISFVIKLNRLNSSNRQQKSY